MDGVFSMKSDVFSFGVLVLEIVTGRRNRGFCETQLDLNLLRYVSTSNKLIATGDFLSILSLYLIVLVIFRRGCCGKKAGAWIYWMRRWAAALTTVRC